MSGLFRDVAQPGSALAWGARGRWFESSRPDKIKAFAKAGAFLFDNLACPIARAEPC